MEGCKLASPPLCNEQALRHYWHYHCMADHTKDTSCHSVLGYKDNLLLTYGVSFGAGDIRPCQFLQA
jgi:hypothetical protein